MTSCAAMNGGDLALAAFAASQDGIFGIGDARACGLDDLQIREREERSWVRLYPGVFRHPGAPATWRGDLRAAAVASAPHGTLSSRTAARIYGLPGGRETPIEVACPRWRRSQVSGLVVHETTFIDPTDVQLVDDLPVMRPERVAFELASIYPSPGFIERVLQGARRQRLITYDSTQETFDRLARRGRPGVVVFRAALERWRDTIGPTDSDMETRLVQALRRAGLPEPVTQYVVHDASGRFVARADAAYPQWRIVIEYDSKQEHSDEWSLARDASRRNRLLALGYQALTARHRDVKTGANELCDAIRACIRRATGEPA
jgi:very-short-patch-repair endonuclease